MVSYYILFENHQQAVALHRALRSAGLRADIAPTPRSVSVCCGVALLVREENMGGVRAYLDAHPCIYKSVERIDQQFDPHRDVYC
jgi:hypothetical protein